MLSCGRPLSPEVVEEVDDGVVRLRQRLDPDPRGLTNEVGDVQGLGVLVDLVAHLPHGLTEVEVTGHQDGERAATEGSHRVARRQCGGQGAAGVGVAETLDDVGVLFRLVGRDPSLDVVRSLCEGWVSALESAPIQATCVDPESGLPTLEYLAVRLGETYGAARKHAH